MFLARMKIRILQRHLFPSLSFQTVVIMDSTTFLQETQGGRKKRLHPGTHERRTFSGED